MASSFEWSDSLPVLSGRDVELGWISQSDGPAILSVFGDPEVIRYWSSPALSGPDATRDLIEEIHQLFARRQLFQWGLRRKQSDELIGTCTLLNLDLAQRRAELGIALASRCWGRGLASDALETLIGFAFGPLGLHRLEADVDPANIRSLRLLERQGFRREGHLRERWLHQGAFQDAIFLGLLEREWTRGESAR
jgi:ribosomal-protein-alanine N-acetyltransferase